MSRPVHENGSLHVAVAGAGVAGLSAALMLSRDGHRVTLLERDTVTSLGQDPEAAFLEERQGTPQARHSHAFLGRLRMLLATELPDVLAALHAAGATDYHLLDDLPDTVEDRSARPGDEHLVLLACRRSTFEAVLRRAALASEHVRLVDGVAVEGLSTANGDDGQGRDGEGRDGHGGAPPTVSGVRIRRTAGDTSELLDADVVVAAGGPRSPVGKWLEQIGVALPEVYEESGIVYLTRFYRHLDRPPDDNGSVQSADALGLAGADLGYIKCAVFRGDNRTFSVTLAPRASDQALRAGLRDTGAFERACALFEPIAPWVDPQRAVPLTGVYTMARLGNRQRHFLDRHGRPLVLGLHALGDAHTSTNPLYGRGCTMAVLQATLLAKALRDHPGRPVERARAYEEATLREIEPWYRVSVAQDELNRRLAEQARAAKRGDDGDDGGDGSSEVASDGEDGAAFLGKVVRDGLLPAARTDAVVARAFFRVLNALQTPESLFADADVTNRVMRTLADPAARDVMPDFQVSREVLLAAVHASA